MHSVALLGKRWTKESPRHLAVAGAGAIRVDQRNDMALGSPALTPPSVQTPCVRSGCLAGT
jgi:hypothetical protein